MKGSEDMLDGVDKVLDGSAKILEVAPDLYEDAIKPTAKETGKTLSLLPKVINAALVPLQKWILEKEYSLAETEKLLAKKLESVGEEKIVTPEAYVAVPALQAISYTMDSAELRNLYANLLAKAMNIDKKDKVHPSFVEIIKQMSPMDALIFRAIMEAPITPLIDLYLSTGTGKNHYRYNISWIDYYDYNKVCVSLDNLCRLRLIEIPFGSSYMRDDNYNPVRISAGYIKCKEELERIGEGQVAEEKRYIKLTTLGKSFYSVCIVE